MTAFRLLINGELHGRLQRHLLDSDVEQVAFLLAAPPEPGEFDLRLTDLYCVPPDEIEFTSDYHVSLSPVVRPKVIKWAWDRGACLVEAHAHLYDSHARFSPSDCRGLDEFVPHVRWRLPGRPYAAIVMAPRSFDALVWAGAGSDPHPVRELVVAAKGPLQATGLTCRRPSGGRRHVR